MIHDVAFVDEHSCGDRTKLTHSNDPVIRARESLQIEFFLSFPGYRHRSLLDCATAFVLDSRNVRCFQCSLLSLDCLPLVSTLTSSQTELDFELSVADTTYKKYYVPSLQHR